MDSVMEMVTFKLKPGFGTHDVKSANTPVNAWVRQQPGFQARRLTQGEGGLWYDVVFWDSAETAQAASARFMADLGGSDFMGMLDPATVQMAHPVVISQA
jgi:hypothetical protein